MEQKEWFIVERIRALTTIFLTRREDLSVSFYDSEGEVDAIVTLNPRIRREAERRFGLFLYGTKSSLTESEVNRILGLKIQRQLKGKEFPYPVGLLDFSVVDNNGYFAWLAEPVVREGVARLHYHEDARSSPFNRESLDRLVAAVNAWYDAFYAAIKV